MNPKYLKPESTETKNKTDSIPAGVILAGGLGTRLRSAYAAGPKSMAPIKGKPFLDYLLTWLRAEGVREVILCVGYKRSQIQRFVGKGHKWGLRVKYSIERELLGTGGAVKRAEQLIAEDRMLVINGDTFVDVNLGELTHFHCSSGALATLAGVKADGCRYGSLHVDKTGRITGFSEKARNNYKVEEENRAINAGVYVFEKRLLRRIRSGRRVSLEREILPSLVKNKKAYGLVKQTYFLDIGVPDDFVRAQTELPKRFRTSDPR